MKPIWTSIARLGEECRKGEREWRALTGGRRVRMNVETLGHFGIGVAGDHPFGIVELVPMRIRCLNVHEKDVLRLRIETGDFHFEGGKDASRREYECQSMNVCLRRVYLPSAFRNDLHERERERRAKDRDAEKVLYHLCSMCMKSIP